MMAELRLAGRTHIAFLLFHTTILEPDFHLLLGQSQIVGNFDATQTRQILAHGEFPFQIE